MLDGPSAPSSEVDSLQTDIINLLQCLDALRSHYQVSHGTDSADDAQSGLGLNFGFNWAAAEATMEAAVHLCIFFRQILFS